MIKFYPFFFALTFFSTAFAQNIAVSGKVIDPNNYLKGETKIFFAFNQNKYDSTKFVTCDSLLNFKITLTNEEILKHAITSMHFSNDSKRNIKCSHIVHIDNILNSELTANQEVINIKADFDYDTYCDFSGIKSAESDGYQKYVGIYVLKRGTEKFKIELTDSYFLKGQYASPKADFTNMEIGSWYFNNYHGHLVIYIRSATSSEFGVTRIIKKKYEIEVKDFDTNTSFTSKNGEITIVKK